MSPPQVQIKTEPPETENDEGDQAIQQPIVKSCLSEKTRANPEKKLLVCSYCPRTFTKKDWRFAAHTKRHSKPYECDICGKKFGSAGDIANHRRVHTGERPYECNFCDKRFKEKSTLRVHIKTHTGEKPHTCEVCQKPFTTKGHLRAHALLHLDCPSAKYPCSFCEKRFYNKSEYTRHFGTHTGEKPYSCATCKRPFLLRYHLKRHERSLKHGDYVTVKGEDYQNKKEGRGKGNYQCTFCGQKFTRHEYLNIHLRTHTGERPYACDECFEHFTSPIALTRHRMVHTGERPFTCSTCGASFKYKHTLQVHERSLRGCRPVLEVQMVKHELPVAKVGLGE